MCGPETVGRWQRAVAQTLIGGVHCPNVLAEYIQSQLRRLKRATGSVTARPMPATAAILGAAGLLCASPRRWLNLLWTGPGIR